MPDGDSALITVSSLTRKAQNYGLIRDLHVWQVVTLRFFAADKGTAENVAEALMCSAGQSLQI